MNSNTYLLISPNDFFTNRRKRQFEDKFDFMESVMKYLDRYNIQYKHFDDSIRVYPSDLFQARKICQELRITGVNYYENGKKSVFFEQQELDDEDHKMSSEELLRLTRPPTKSVQGEKTFRAKKPIQSTLQEIMLFPFY